VFAAVYHAEVVAHRVGEPFGTLVLALAVTVIETALIVSVMIAARPKRQDWRATLFSPPL
jgi:Ca2+:H+ antiporter